MDRRNTEQVDHIQALAEVNMENVGLPNENLYVRGCAGFTGFPTNDMMSSQLIDFSSKMTKRLGERWADWGSEQVASNYLVANAHDTEVLPFPQYADA